METVLGSKWKRVGKARPSKGNEIVNDALASALEKKKLTFTQLELYRLQVQDLEPHSFIKVGEQYYAQNAFPPVHERLSEAHTLVSSRVIDYLDRHAEGGARGHGSNGLDLRSFRAGDWRGVLEASRTESGNLRFANDKRQTLGRPVSSDALAAAATSPKHLEVRRALGRISTHRRLYEMPVGLQETRRPISRSSYCGCEAHWAPWHAVSTRLACQGAPERVPAKPSWTLSDPAAGRQGGKWGGPTTGHWIR